MFRNYFRINCRNTDRHLAVGDVNGDKLDDVFIGGAMFHKGRFLIQQANGQFKTADLLARH